MWAYDVVMPNPKTSNTPDAAAIKAAETIITAFGGPTQMAILFEIKQPSVSEWKKKGIPKARLQTLRLMRPDLFVSPTKAVA